MLSRKFFILLFVTILWGFSESFANSQLSKYYPQKFITNYETGSLESQKLKEELFKIISNDHRGHFSYAEARKVLFGKLHLKKNKFGHMVKDVYCEKEFYSRDGVGPGKIPNHRKINCEHTWPQSKFSREFSKNAQKVDLHHLFPTDAISNSARSNNIFSEVNGEAVNASCWSSKIGESKRSHQRAFEPPLAHRGNVARAMFYFSTRYKMPIDAVQEHYLRKWHREDPVDEEERERNNDIHNFQKNRNPFIDRPDFVDDIRDF